MPVVFRSLISMMIVLLSYFSRYWAGVERYVPTNSHVVSKNFYIDCALFNLIQYKIAYKISRLTNDDNFMIYRFVYMCTVTKVAEVLVTVRLK